MGSLDFETYAAFETLYDANSTLEGLTVGGFVRADYRQGDIHPNRIEYRMVADNDVSGSGTTIRQCTAHLTMVLSREHAFGTGDTPEASGEMEQIERQMESTFAGVVPSGTDWGFSMTSHPRWSGTDIVDEHEVRKTMTVTFFGGKS